MKELLSGFAVIATLAYVMVFHAWAFVVCSLIIMTLVASWMLGEIITDIWEGR